MSLDDWNDGWLEGQRDMLAKCIAAVETLDVLTADFYLQNYIVRLFKLDDALAALRALQEKP